MAGVRKEARIVKRIPYAEIAYALLLVGWIAMICWMVSTTR